MDVDDSGLDVKLNKEDTVNVLEEVEEITDTMEFAGLGEVTISNVINYPRQWIPL